MFTAAGSLKSGQNLVSFSSVVLLGLFLILLAAPSSGFFSSSEPVQEPKKPGSLATVRLFVSENLAEARRSVDALVGREVVDTSLGCLQNAGLTVSEGLATGLNVLVKLVSEFLTALGVEDRHSLSRLQFTQQEVATVLVWTLAALIGYWLLSLVLGLVGCVVRRVLWLIKLAAFSSAFLLILRRVEDSYQRGALVLGLVLLAVLLGGFRGSPGETSTARLEGLEQRMAELNRKVNSQRQRISKEDN